jgi:histidinol-phosphatase (PHP family)
MRQLADYHMHTPLCRHATGEPVEYAARAVQLGLEEIGFSDHAPMREDGFDSWRMDLADLDSYVAAVAAARRSHPGLSIRLALEVDYLPGQEAWIRELAMRHPWDYFIGSVHYLGGWDIDNPQKLAEWKHREVKEVWVAYVERLTEAARTGLFDILGHIDLPKKFGHYPDESVLPQYERFLQVAGEVGVAIELNTAGLRKDCREIYPSREILGAAFRCGVPITFGSDAHAPNEVGSAWPEALALARSVGYQSCCRFAGRRRSEVSLPEAQ